MLPSCVLQRCSPPLNVNGVTHIRWTASHFDRVDPKFLSHIRELKEEKLREQAEAQKLLAEAASLGARRSTP